MSLELALEWADQGHRVLPVNGSTKRPLIKKWQEAASSSEVVVYQWWQTYPDARVGIATGAPGYDVLDFDVAGGKPGMAQLIRLIDAGVLEPGTFKVVATPSGGRHLYFRGTDQHNKQNDKAIPGVDFRGVGGMILAAGNPGYTWVAGRDLLYEELKTIDWLALAACLATAEPERKAAPAREPQPIHPVGQSGGVGQRGSSRLVAPLGAAFDNAPGEESPLDWFVRNHDLGKLLSDDGWAYSHTEDGRDYYTRPGKHVRDGVSANIMVNRDGRQTLMNYSTTVDWLPTDRGLSAAQYFAYRDYNGNLKDAARHIRTRMMPQRVVAQPMASAATGANQSGLSGTDTPPGSPVASPGTRSAELVPAADVGTPQPVREFWGRRPELREVWWKAQVGGVSPWAVLGSILANVAGRLGPHVALPPLGGVGGSASLNILVAVSGNSGTGKGRAGPIAREFMGAPHPPQRKPGTGQGIAAMFTEQTKEGPVQSNDTVVLVVNEITALGAHMGQQGATITSTLLEVYMGEELGEHYANKELRRPVKDGHYRLAMVAGVQPGNSNIILDHAESGLPQRFIWVPAFWPDSILPEGGLRPPAPGPELGRWRAWSAILPGSLDDSVEAAWSPTDAVDNKQAAKKDEGAQPVPVKDRVMVTYAPRVRHAIEADHSRRLNALKKRLAAGEDDPGDPDSHLLLTQAKVATLLACWLDSALYVSDEMWELARWVIWVSTDTRLKAQARLRSKAQEKTANRAAQRVTETAMVSEIAERQHNALTIKILDRIQAVVGKASGDWVTTREITLGIASRDKKAMREAGIEIPDLLADLVEAGRLEHMPAEGPGGKGERYRTHG
jgi:hypothetical protein